MGERGWTLNELAAAGHLEFGDGYRARKDQLGVDGYPILRVAEIMEGRLVPRFSEYVRAEYRAVMRGKVSQPGDVVLAKKATVGRVAIVPEDSPEFSYGPQVCYFRTLPGSPLRSRFLYHWLRSDQFLHQTIGVKNQTCMVDRLNFADLGNLLIVVPSQLEQQAIAEVLGSLDDKIAFNETTIATALGLGGACYESAASSCVPEMIGDLAELFDGPRTSPHANSVGPWLLGIRSLKAGYLDLTESAHFSEDDFPRWTRRVQPRSGDVLFSYETRLGDAALMPSGIRGSLGRRMALLRGKTSVSGALLLQAYLSPIFQEEIRRRTIRGAKVDRLPLKEMPGWRIFLPVESSRERLSAKLDALHATVAQAGNENRALADLRDTLLPQLVTGKLRVKDVTHAIEEAV